MPLTSASRPVTQQYRPEIDGLRAIAVVAVLVYHAELTIQGVPSLPGGFLGVDVFFVISGYLISRILLRELGAGTLSIWRFYERRVRRILPTLLFVLIASLPLAWLSLAPKAMLEYAGSLLSALAFGSNIWFFFEDSYAAEASLLKPLLHTWSLAVEEQFYLFVPGLLMGLWAWARRRIVVTLLALLVVSLFFADFLSRRSPDAAFYLLPTRAWELLAGSVLAALEGHSQWKDRPRAAGVLVTAALIAVLLPMLLYTDSMPHPSVLTAIPVGGVVVLLWFVQPRQPVARLLSAPPMRYLGAISYSLYLWHMPLFAYARNVNWLGGGGSKLSLLALSVVLAHLTNRLIENPMRWKAKSWQLWLFVGLSTIVIAAAGTFAIATQGAAGRAMAAQTSNGLPELDGGDVDSWTAKAIIFNLGDSHSSALSGALHEAAVAGNFALRSISASGIMPIDNLYYIANNKFDERYGPTAVAQLTEMIRREIAGQVGSGRQVYVMLTGRLPLYLSNEQPVHPLTGKPEPGTPHAFTTDGKTLADFDTVVAAMRATVDSWLELGAKVVLVYPVPEMIYDIPSEAFRDKQFETGPEDAFQSTEHTRLPIADAEQRAAAAYAALDGLDEPGIVRLYPRDFLCASGTCEGVVDGKLLYRDDDHLSAHGARLLVQRLLAATGLGSD